MWQMVKCVVLLTFRDGESRAPLVSQDVQTDAAVGVDVGVVDTGGEVDLRGLERIVGREVNGQEEDASRVWRVTLKQVSFPFERPTTIFFPLKKCVDLQDP